MIKAGGDNKQDRKGKTYESAIIQCVRRRLDIQEQEQELLRERNQELELVLGEGK